MRKHLSTIKDMKKSPTLVAMTMNTDIPSLEKTFFKFRILRLTINVLMPAGNAE